MFENYSFGDLLANIYKKRLINIILFLVLSLSVISPLVIKTINKRTIVKEGVQYSTYISYKITAPEGIDVNALYSRRGYSDFYTRLLELNLNGAYIFNDVDEKTLDQMAKELDTSAVTLKNSNFDYWEKKVVINYISTNLGVSVKILTPSKLVNDEIEKKFDLIIDKYKNTYENVKIEKLESNYSKELTSKENINSGYSLKNLVIKVFVIEVALVILIALLNFVLYIFNPTINREGDYSKYKIKFVQEIDSMDDIIKIVNYQKQKFNLNTVCILSSNKKMLSNFNIDIEGVKIIKENSISDIVDAENILIVEEYGITRYSSFERLLQRLKNFDKNILAIVTYKL